MPKVSKNFDSEEFECRGCQDGKMPIYCSHGYEPLCNVDAPSIQMLQALRDHVSGDAGYDVPLVIHSACRCEGHNRHVGGAKNSFHLGTEHRQSKAFDVRIPEHLSGPELAIMAEKVGFTGIGIYQTFVHMDTRQGKARWWG